MDLRTGRDHNRLQEFLRAVAGGPVTPEDSLSRPDQQRWNFSWRESTAVPGRDVRVAVEVERDGCMQFTVFVDATRFEKVPSTVYPYSLAWALSVAYARSVLDAAKEKALQANDSTARLADSRLLADVFDPSASGEFELPGTRRA